MKGEQEAHALARPDGELGGLLQVVAADRHVAAQLERVGARDRVDRVIGPAHPGPDAPVVEARREAHRDRHLTPHALDHSHDAGV
jgi:hypothetical protein